MASTVARDKRAEGIAQRLTRSVATELAVELQARLDRDIELDQAQIKATVLRMELRRLGLINEDDHDRAAIRAAVERIHERQRRLGEARDTATQFDLRVAS